MKHTPGPWKIIEHPDKNGDMMYYVNGLSENICDLNPLNPLGEEQVTSRANAMLIAFAPMLLEVLIELEKIISDSGCDDYLAIDKARMLIDKIVSD